MLALGLTAFRPFIAQSQETTLDSQPTRGNLPIMSPTSNFWDVLPSIQFPVSGQNITTPMLLGASKHITVVSANNGTWIAFRIMWNDPTKDVNTSRTEAYRDAVAIMFPILNESAPPFLGMGQQGKPVNIWQWKGDWQKDIDTEFQDVQNQYPYLWVDYYPFANVTQPYTVPPLVKINRNFSAGWAANNPLSQPLKVTPVENLIAEGFGTLTHQVYQDVIGKGVWKDGRWYVIMARPLSTTNPSDSQIRSGGTLFVAFAVWDGANREVDGRKSISNWHTLNVGKVPPTLLEILTSIGAPILGLAVVVTMWYLISRSEVRSS